MMDRLTWSFLVMTRTIGEEVVVISTFKVSDAKLCKLVKNSFGC